ncbi:MAG TPA: phospho-N-acetylmuramoyl-pentapeptide-transferase, partial [Chloroflexota bacterium]|nr:phospho-N-acetylmuramoyl-pentapeptide-transferase [Chloroflexota bacterium]
FGPRWLRFLKTSEMGKQLNPSEPEEHAHKEGTPTMGGVVFFFPFVAVTLAFQVLAGGQTRLLLPLLIACALAILGAVDDSQTLIGRERSAGLSPRVKWAVQIVLGLVTAGVLVWLGEATMRLPFAGQLSVPGWLYVPLAAFVFVATTSSVAITDGMDSLVATTGAIAVTAFGVIALWQGDGATGALAATMAGALLAYLWFNAFPAQMFMGDVGALPLGGLLATVALTLGQPLLLIPIGIIFVANGASDVLQVLSVKLRGKRMFRIAPLHHHFRRLGWPETWVVQRFWIVGAVGALVGLLLALSTGGPA